MPSLDSEVAKGDYYIKVNQKKILAIKQDMLNREDGKNYLFLYQRLVKVPVSVLLREVKMIFGYSEKSMLVNWGFNNDFQPDFFFASMLLRVVCPTHPISKLIEDNSFNLESLTDVEITAYT